MSHSLFCELLIQLLSLSQNWPLAEPADLEGESHDELATFAPVRRDLPVEEASRPVPLGRGLRENLESDEALEPARGGLESRGRAPARSRPDRSMQSPTRWNREKPSLLDTRHHRIGKPATTDEAPSLGTLGSTEAATRRRELESPAESRRRLRLLWMHIAGILTCGQVPHTLRPVVIK
ncbi:unnamed protein product [Protopolystoma xenopodis]|uniref:Uncharacterized protein n=1 Tax=Protopolystoma xenopodis TaxID=117903 RepID=A0A3S5FHB2_9PLAT|nr:unnamed protein product [Protopolystoma xenopodis]